VVWQVYKRNTRVSWGEGTIISLSPNGCRALNKAGPEIMGTGRVFQTKRCRVAAHDPSFNVHQLRHLQILD
jgi:hypothetical protein